MVSADKETHWGRDYLLLLCEILNKRRENGYLEGRAFRMFHTFFSSVSTFWGTGPFAH